MKILTKRSLFMMAGISLLATNCVMADLLPHPSRNWERPKPVKPAPQPVKPVPQPIKPPVVEPPKPSPNDQKPPKPQPSNVLPDKPVPPQPPKPQPPAGEPPKVVPDKPFRRHRRRRNRACGSASNRGSKQVDNLALWENAVAKGAIGVFYK